MNKIIKINKKFCRKIAEISSGNDRFCEENIKEEPHEENNK